MTTLLCPACGGHELKPSVSSPDLVQCADCLILGRTGCGVPTFGIEVGPGCVRVSRTRGAAGGVSEAALSEKLRGLDAPSGPLHLDGVLEALADPSGLLTGLRSWAAEGGPGLSITTRPDDDPAAVRWLFSPRSLAHLVERAGWTCRWQGRNPLRPRSLWQRASGKLARLLGVRGSRANPRLELAAVAAAASGEDAGPLPSLGLVMIAAAADLELLIGNLERLPPYFDQTVVVFDAEPGQVPLPLQEALARLPGGAARHNVKVVCRESNFIFGDQRNHGHQMSQTDWIFQLDCDENVVPEQLELLRPTAARLDRLGMTVCGLPRRHFNIVTGEMFEGYPDYQFRLMRRAERWVAATHDYPKTVVERPDKTWWCDQILIEHRPRPRTDWWWREADADGKLQNRMR